ncbi:GNAT family N-acetyltransferase [Flavihumibacter fluvii]|uniref:GNAT family N-acetyltransferase n=1 Tax=Flavihumibacter fluvii TaxID=2838157 RepID=UPI001BDEB739|nr:GNAT family N-acetyltransferase [Flavihumibacter fluvii]ULQ51152.1 GNAT family N-acetyltransferase [Flavihumibacter fluvii]
MSISSATNQDIAELVDLVNSAYRGDQAKKGWTNEADLLVGGIRIDAAEMQEMMADDDHIVLKHTIDGKITGCVSLVKKDGYVYLGMLTVSPRLQGGGTGKKLLQAAEDFARSASYQRIRMTVITARKELISWYQRHGYSDTGERLPFPYEPGYGEPSQPLEFMIIEKKWPQ